MATSALAELVLLRDSGPSEEDVRAAVEMSTREHEEAVQTNCYWVERLRAAALPSRVRGSLAERFAAWEALRVAALARLSVEEVRRVLSALLPHAGTNYTSVSLVPESCVPPACTALAAALDESLMRCVAPRIIR